MANPPHPPFDNRTDEATGDVGPSLRLRFDPPPPGAEEAVPEFSDVINDVEQLSLGIDTMLRRANSSSLGTTALDAGHQVEDDDESIDDAPMMSMFDEEAPPPSTPTDMHAIDRMLATRAEAAMNADVANAASSAFERSEIAVAAESSAPSASSEDHAVEDVMLEGDFEDISALIEKSVPAFVPPAADMPVPLTTSPVMRQMEPARVEESIRRETTIVQSVAIAADASAGRGEPISDRVIEESFAPPPPLDLSLAPAQAQGIAAALAAASAGGTAGGTGVHPPSHPAHTSAPMPVDSVPSATVREEPPPAAAAALAAPASLAVQPVQAVNSPATEATIKKAVARLPSRHFASIGARIVEVVALTNLPLRMVPKSMQHAVNLVAVSLALWAPAVWALGPKVAAARQAAHANAAQHEDAHGESSSKADAEAHGESKDAHGAKSSTSTKKSSSSRTKASSKKSSAKKADAAPSGGH